MYVSVSVCSVNEQQTLLERYYIIGTDWNRCYATSFARLKVKGTS